MGGSESGTITAWDLVNGQVMFTLCGHSSSVTTIEIIKPTLIASGSKDTNIILWDLSLQSISLTLNGHKETVNCIQYLTNDKFISGSDDQTIIIWDLSIGAIEKRIELSSRVNAIKQVDNEIFAVGLASGNIDIYNVNSFEYLFTLSGHTNAVTDLLLLNNGYLASCSIDGYVFIWKVAEKLSVHKFSPFEGKSIFKIVEMNDITLVVCGDIKDMVQLKINYDQQTVEVVQYLKDPNEYACSNLIDIYKKTIVKTSYRDAKLFSPIDSKYFLTLNTLQTNDPINAINKIESKFFIFLCIKV